MSDISVFRVVSTGQVLENLKISERVISVKLIEQDPFTDGETKEVAEEALELYRSKKVLESNDFQIDAEISKFELIAIEAELYPTDTMTEVWY